MLNTLFAVLSLSLGPRLCSVVPNGGPQARSWMDDATLVVRARVLSRDTGVVRITRQQVQFRIEEVLKSNATPIPTAIALDGYTADRDDFNKGPVPYDYVRPSGLMGSCFADQYRPGADYLLLLVESKPGVFTTHWAPLLPVNEQLHGTDDPWLAWVRAHVARAPGKL